MSTGNVVGITGGGGSVTVDTTITDGSDNAVSGNAVHDALAALPLATTILTAAQALSGQRAVVAVGASGCNYADQTNAAHFGKVIGLTVSAVASGAQAEIQKSGPIENPGWAWTPGADVFLASTGLLTQTEPAAGNFQQVVGYALTATTLWISLFEPIRN